MIKGGVFIHYNLNLKGIIKMINYHELLDTITKERPVGTETNEMILCYLENEFIRAGYGVDSLPFDCAVWEHEESSLKIGETEFSIVASPFSKPFGGTGEAIIIKSIQDLQEQQLRGKIVILCEKIAQSPLQPKDFPFYYPDEHKVIISLLEEQMPKAIVTVTSKDPMRGMCPFPMFEDGNFLIPSAYVSDHMLPQIMQLVHKSPLVTLAINSKNTAASSRQLVAYKKSPKSMGKIVVCAHMDTKYNTAGALDNATGVAVLMQMMQSLKDVSSTFEIDFVPFNSEEYFGNNGEVKYLEYINNRQDKIALVINIDSPCHLGSQTAISYYNLNENIKFEVDSIITKYDQIVKGNEWYSGDHYAFVLKGIPCLAVTSSDFFIGALEWTHTPKDTLDTIDPELITPTAKFLSELTNMLVTPFSLKLKP